MKKKSKALVFILALSVVSIGITNTAYAKGGFHSSSRSSSYGMSKSRSRSSSSVKIHSPKGVYKSGTFKSSGSSKAKSVSKTPTYNKNVNKNININKNVNVNKTVVHKHYSSPVYHSTHITPSGGSFRSSFWDNYWMYRALTHHNTVVVAGDNGVAQTVSYGYSGLWKDILTIVIVLVILSAVVKAVRRY